MEQNKFAKIAEILQNEENVALLTGKSIPETIKVFADLGLSVTEDELREFYKSVTAEEGELDENALASVAGGMSWRQYWGGVKATAKGLWDGFWGL